MPPPISSFASITITSRPASARPLAMARPTTPAPITTASARSTLVTPPRPARRTSLGVTRFAQCDAGEVSGQGSQMCEQLPGRGGAHLLIVVAAFLPGILRRVANAHAQTGEHQSE